MFLLHVGKEENYMGGIPVSAERVGWFIVASLNLFPALALQSSWHVDLGACAVRNKNSDSSILVTA